MTAIEEDSAGAPVRAAALGSLVDGLAGASGRAAASKTLLAHGAAAAEALGVGLRDGRWEVRRACVTLLAKIGGSEAGAQVTPLLRDPKSRVRSAALYSIGQLASHDASLSVPALLMERVRLDESLRVRRQAVIQLAFHHADPQLEGFFQQLLDSETDPKLHKFAGIGWFLCHQRAVASDVEGAAGARTC